VPDSKHPLNEGEIHEVIEPLFSDIMSRSRPLDPLLQSLAELDHHQQQRILHWIEVIARTNAELAYQFANQAPGALQQLTLPDFDTWVLQAMHTYDHQGLYAAVTSLAQLHRFVELAAMREQIVILDDVQQLLETFLQGLSGRHLAIEKSKGAWTDTETVYLPASISVFDNRKDNFLLYKAAAGLLWAQTWFGGFALDNDGVLRLKALTKFENFDKARSVFLALETERLLIRIEHELPGLGRQMRALVTDRQTTERWRQALHALDADSTIDDCLAAIPPLLDQPLPEPAIFALELQLQPAQRTIQQRISLQREQLRKALDKLVPDAARQRADQNGVLPGEESEDGQLELKKINLPGSDDGGFELSFKGNMITPSPEVQALLQSILQDLGEIPLDYLVAGGSADPGQPRGNNQEIPQSDEEVMDGLPYPEWDYRRGHYRQEWCYLHEQDVDDGPEDFVHDTLRKYATVLPQLRKSFEALRGEDKWLRRQTDGDEIDIDALVEALADMQHGEELNERLYTRLSRIDRNIAVMLMIDMSGSTKGWVNDAEREALVLLCQALEILGDQYAIYGFSGMTRKRCELYRIKRFDETYSETIDRRISGISAKDYTRMGVTIRHLNKLLEAVPAKTKLLITLSDGKPEDFDGYGGEYGIEDTRQALIESRRLGIHPFCITIDTEASNYLPHMYGAHSYAVVDDVRALPLRVADVYRRLTH